jgi:hypothetical protein
VIALTKMGRSLFRVGLRPIAIAKGFEGIAIMSKQNKHGYALS